MRIAKQNKRNFKKEKKKEKNGVIKEKLCSVFLY